MLSPQRSTLLPRYSEYLKNLTMQVLNNMTTFIALPLILQRILQDPVYGRGKLGEIQGLVLGMLDSFNYEQTLLETTTSLLNRDLHWSLRNLKASMTRGLNPKQDYCCICLQQYKRRQQTGDQIIVFSCGHLYHSLCLLSKECGTETTGQMKWTCFKCSASHKGEKVRLTSLETKKRTPVSFAQTSTECLLDSQQAQAFDQLCRLYRGTSRLALLTELSRDHGGEKHGFVQVSQGDSALNSVFQNETFQLHLNPPPLLED
uniref:RING-type domain-containing protein n=3 Tax=Micrurus lemniscatus lemniscatus TaxID=129467 RepID=A0A2D4HJE8_MICLE